MDLGDLLMIKATALRAAALAPGCGPGAHPARHGGHATEGRRNDGMISGNPLPATRAGDWERPTPSGSRGTSLWCPTIAMVVSWFWAADQELRYDWARECSLLLFGVIPSGAPAADSAGAFLRAHASSLQIASSL
jgi:hypothetical protein